MSSTYLHNEKRAYNTEELNSIFWQHDRNRDCRLSKKELWGAFKDLGAGVILSVFRASRALRYADDNGDGYISEDEMEKLVNYADRLKYRYIPVYTKEELKDIFHKFNGDGSLRLSKKQLKAAFNDLGATFPSYRAKKALNYAYQKKDGYITEQEIDKLLDYTVKLRYKTTIPSRPTATLSVR